MRPGTGPAVLHRQPSPIRCTGTTAPQPTAPPTIGEHTDRILREVLEMAPEAIASLREQRVV
ncbi:hypothetical protein ACEN8K_05495 [Variovorax sp. CT11-76]